MLFGRRTAVAVVGHAARRPRSCFGLGLNAQRRPVEQVGEGRLRAAGGDAGCWIARSPGWGRCPCRPRSHRGLRRAARVASARTARAAVVMGLCRAGRRDSLDAACSVGRSEPIAQRRRTRRPPPWLGFSVLVNLNLPRISRVDGDAGSSDQLVFLAAECRWQLQILRHESRGIEPPEPVRALLPGSCRFTRCCRRIHCLHRISMRRPLF